LRNTILSRARIPIPPLAHNISVLTPKTLLFIVQ
jgi:hypothetical protein